jgi:hypothetical protein
MTENIPAAETTAAVSAPETALATESPARIRVTTNINTAAIGVLMISIMDDVFPIFDHHQSLKETSQTSYLEFPTPLKHRA